MTFSLAAPRKQANVRSLTHSDIYIQLYPYSNQDLCPVTCLHHYINNTKSIRPGGINKLLLAASPPFHAARPSTITDWVKKSGGRH